MRKILTFILIVLLIILAVTLVVNGIQINDFEILTLQQLKNENIELNDKILQAESTIETQYKTELDNLENKLNELASNKKQYEDLVAQTSESNFEIASREENYKLEYLYFQIGEIAKRNNVDLKIEVSNGSSLVKGLYDITLITSYEAIVTDESGYIKLVDFISDVENDPTLGFKVEDFSLVPYSVPSKSIVVEPEVKDDDGKVIKPEVRETVQCYGLIGTFTAKNIAIYDIAEILSNNTENDTESSTENSTENTNQSGTIDITVNEQSQ